MGARISLELGGPIAMLVVLGAFGAGEAVLFWTTRAREASSDKLVES